MWFSKESSIHPLSIPAYTGQGRGGCWSLSHRASESKEHVRLSSSLGEGEIKFVQERMVTVGESLKDHGIKCESNNVPRIAVLGSGGGERAMIGLLGCLDQMYHAKLLDCALYMCGVSGSTWCMASMYEDPSWTSKVPSIKESLVKRLTETDINISELKKWLSQASEKENYSLTDVWAATVVYDVVKQIDTTSLSNLKRLEPTNPYPIYTVNDKGLQENGDTADSFYELSPHEVGYSHLGAFVDTSNSRSQFEAGVLKQKISERDMLYLQGLCGSTLADGEDEINQVKSTILHWLKKIFESGNEEKAQAAAEGVPLYAMATEALASILHLFDCDDEEESTQHVKKIHKLMAGVNSEHAKKPEKKLVGKSKEEKFECLAEYAADTFSTFKDFMPGSSNITKITLKTILLLSTWTWGTTYNLLYKIPTIETKVPDDVWSDKYSYLEDAGIVLNAAFVAALRPERNVKLILSFDFSAGDPFKTVVQAAELFKQTGIPFPPVEVSDEDRKQPKDFYVFKSENTPTVIQIPLFNIVNCKGDVDKWKKMYPTFRPPYHREMMDELIRLSGLNVINNKEKILKEIADLCK